MRGANGDLLSLGHDAMTVICEIVHNDDRYPMKYFSSININLSF